MQQTHRKQQPLRHQIDIKDISQLPLPDEQRHLTDVCCLIVGVLFGLLLFIVACAVYNSANLQKASYPTDSNGKVCMFDTNTGLNNYPFVYFNDIQNPNSDRHCVLDCPQAGVPAKCYDNCTITYYPNYPTSSELGSFCLPEDPNLRAQLLYKANINTRFNSIKAMDYLMVGVGISFGLALLWLVLVQLFPKGMFWVALVIAAFILFVSMLVFFIGSGNTLVDGQGWAIIFGLIFLGLLVAVIVYGIYNRKAIYTAGCFLQIAGPQLRANLSTLIWIPIFIAITFLFGWLLSFEYLAFSSTGTPSLQKGSVYYTNSSSWFGNLLLVIQGLWGLSFFRDCFNYIISGLSCEWYFQKPSTWLTPVRRLFFKNLGSVAGGSFLSSLFFLPSLFFSILTPGVSCCLCDVLDLARSDVYTWIYLTGNSYCGSSRQTQYLCNRSKICRHNESLIAVYTVVARVVLALTGMMIVYWIARDNLVESKVPPHLLLGMFFVCMYVTCYFADLHTLVAQAYLVCFLAEYDIQQENYKQMKKCPPRLRQLVTDVDNRTDFGFPLPY